MSIWDVLDADPTARRRMAGFTIITIWHALGRLDEATIGELPLRLEEHDGAVHVTLARRSLGSIATADLVA